jgi:hypothetical protein
MEQTMKFTIEIRLDQPHENPAPTRDEFAAVLSQIAFAAMLQAIGRGLPRPSDMPEDVEMAKFALAQLPSYVVNACQVEHADGAATVHV